MVRYVPLATALLLACGMYLPAIPAGLFTDDYAYLLAVRKMGLGEFVQAALDPTSVNTPLQVPGGFWRPLSALSWQVMEPLFGSNGVPYHLLLLAIHLFGVTMVWFLARRIAGGTVGPAAAALLFALHPASVQAVAWASSVNSMALPLALAAWLVAIPGMKVGAPTRARWLWAAALFFSLALLFRETIAAVGLAVSLWYLAVNPPPIRSLTARGALSWGCPVLAFAVPVLVYLLVSTVFFTHSSSGNRFVLSTGGIHNWGFYLRYVGVPIGPPTALPLKLAGAGVGVLLLLAIPGALLARRPAIAALLFAFVISLGSYSFVDFGVSIRYLYIPLALLALALALFLAECEEPLSRRSPTLARTALAGLCLVAVPIALYGNVRVERWVSEGPDQQDAWLEQVTSTWPVWPHDGGRLFSANTPFSLAIFDGFALPPAVEYVYDGRGPDDVIVIAEDDIPKVKFILTEQDEIFVFDQGKPGH